MPWVTIVCARCTLANHVSDRHAQLVGFRWARLSPTPRLGLTRSSLMKCPSPPIRT